MRKNQPAGADLKDLPAFAEALVKAWNTFFQMGRGRARDRRFAFNKDSSNAINQINNMDTPQAVYFRYFWMEALAVPEAWQHVTTWLTNRDAFDIGLGQARRMYLDLCIKQQSKALEISQPGIGPGKLRELAENKAVSTLKKALRNWFEVSDQDFEAWWASQSPGVTQVELDLHDAGPSPQRRKNSTACKSAGTGATRPRLGPDWIVTKNSHRSATEQHAVSVSLLGERNKSAPEGGGLHGQVRH